MRTLPLGSAEVSAMCLGAMYFGTRNDEASSFELLDQYFDAGGRFIDTANIYAFWVPGAQGGESERVLGRWMRDRGNRDKLFIASKVGFGMPGQQAGLSRQQIEDECDKSLERLGVDTIDLYYAHVDDRGASLEETLGALNWLVGEGKVRFLGASNFRTWRIEESHWTSHICGWPEYCCVQQRYTYLRPKPGTSFAPQIAVDDDLLDYVHMRTSTSRDTFTLLAYSPLLGGAYTRSDRPIPEAYAGPDSAARLAALRDVAQDNGATLNQIVLAWMLHSDPPVIPVMAASTPEQMAENLGALAISLSKADMTYLNEAGA